MPGYLIQPTSAGLHNQNRDAKSSLVKAYAGRSIRPGALLRRIAMLGKDNDIELVRQRRGGEPLH